MTHCRGYRAAAVAHAAGVLSLGVDAEPHERLPEGVLDLVSIPVERQEIAALPGRGDLHWDRILFSAKETTYKTWFPLTPTGERSPRTFWCPDRGRASADWTASTAAGWWSKAWSSPPS